MTTLFFTGHRYLALVVGASALLLSAVPVSAQNWLQSTVGWANVSSGQTVSYNTTWDLGDRSLTGTTTVARNFSGSAWTAFESFATSAAWSSGPTTAYTTPSALPNQLGGASGSYHFTSAAGSNLGGSQTSTIAFSLSDDAPAGAYVTLFDPGAFNGSSSGARYSFNASLNGAVVDTSSWTLELIAPYGGTPSPSRYSWDPSTGVFQVNVFPIEPSNNVFPDTIAYFNIGNAVFDSLTVSQSYTGPNVGTTANVDTYGIGMVSPVAVPEPSSALLLGIVGMMGILRRRRSLTA